MGAALTSSMSIAGHLGELVGYKAGLALTREEIAVHLIDAPDIRDIVLLADNQPVRVRSEDFEAAVHGLLYRVGNIPTPSPLPPFIAAFRRYEHDPTHSKVLMEVLTRCSELLKDRIDNTPQGASPDFFPLLKAVRTEFGCPGVNIALALINALALRLHVSPWTPSRWFDWDDTAQLRDLFASESLDTQYGSFIDQRFIDYLAQNSLFSSSAI